MPSDSVPGAQEYHLYFVPQKTKICSQILEESGFLGDIVVGELPLLFLPLEQDLLSLEIESSFQDLYLVQLLHILVANERTETSRV